jgi:hypothetical protein
MILSMWADRDSLLTLKEGTFTLIRKIVIKMYSHELNPLDSYEYILTLSYIFTQERVAQYLLVKVFSKE